jgi:hypothetical protein
VTWLQPLTGGAVPASAKPRPKTDSYPRNQKLTRPTSFSLTHERIAKLKRIAPHNATAWISAQIDNAPEPKE